jgi:hypothetical protein
MSRLKGLTYRESAREDTIMRAHIAIRYPINSKECDGRHYYVQFLIQ